MRIIAGQWRSRRLLRPRTTETKPLPDRVRESLFAQLGDLAGQHVLDLYSGSGALAIEAVSRGAHSVVCVERAPRTLSCLRANLASLELESQVRVVASDVPRALRRFAGALVLLTAIVTGGLLVKYVGDPLWCKKCALHVPYAELARELRSKGFEGGKIISWFYPYLISGNLRPYFPGSAIASLKFPIFNPPGLKAPGRCLAIWDADRKDGEQGYVLAQARTRMGAAITGAETVNTIYLPLAGLGKRRVGFSYVLIPNGQGTCR